MLAYFIYFGLIALYFHPLLNCEGIFVERDLSAYFIPPKYLWVQMAKSFDFPFWNPHNYSGFPILGAMQPGVLYPPHIAYFFLPFNVAWNWLIILHFVFCGATLYLLLRYLKASKTASFAGGVTFMLSGYLLSVHNLLTHLFAVPWFPLILIYFLKYLNTRKKGHLILASIFLTMQFLAGAPEIVILVLCVLFMIALFPGTFTEGEIKRSVSLKALVLATLLFLLLSAVQLIPFYELKGLSIRNSGLSYHEATVWSFAWRDFIQFFLPDAFGYFQSHEKYWSNQAWLKTVYLGIMPFLFSVFYFAGKDKKRWLFLALMVVSLLLALGGNTPLYNLLYRIPPLNGIRYPVKFLFLFFVTISITAALGLDQLRKGTAEGDRKTKVIIYLIFYGGFLFAALWGYLNLFEKSVITFLDSAGFKPGHYNDIEFNLHNLKRFLLFSFLFCLLLLVYLRRRWKNFPLYMITGLLTLDLFLANYGFYFALSWKWYLSPHVFAEGIMTQDNSGRYFMSIKTAKEFQNFPYDKAALSPAYASLYDLYSIGGSEVMRIYHHEMFVNILNGSASATEAKRFFDVAGVRYIIVSYEIEDRDFKRLSSLDTGKGEAYLYEYLRYPGRIIFFGKAHHVENDQKMGEKLLDRSIDLRTELLILSAEKEEGPEAPAEGKIRLLSYGPNKVVVDCESAKSGFLYLTDTYYPGWKAYVDGRDTKIHRANLAFRAVKVPAGRHRVVFVYRPWSIYLGACVTCAGMILLIFIVRRKPREDS
jgi:hypothetical protein